MNAPVKATKAPSKKATDYKPTAMTMTWAHACRDIVITALNNGQIITIALLSFLGLIIFKLENADKADVKKAVMIVIKHLVKTLSSFDINEMIKDFETQSRVDLNIFNNLEEQKKTIKKELQKISEDKKVFFFIDELDRCKPLFAINLLERI